VEETTLKPASRPKDNILNIYNLTVITLVVHVDCLYQRFFDIKAVFWKL